MRTQLSLALTLLLVASAAQTACSDSLAAGQRPRVGQVTLHNSGDPAAQQDFLDGLAALHSFWYEEARDLFRQAQETDPGFALAYWGEAMSHYQPIWGTTNRSGGRSALTRLDDEAGDRLARYGTEIEQVLVDAARGLFDGDGQEEFSQVLGEAHEEFPDNTEIAAFYALSLQGLTTRWGQHTAEDRRLLEESAAILERQMELRPEHPGVLHYLIHALDGPATAARALEAADTYIGVAPDASHALHMPSHIYVQIGDWDGVVDSNRRAWAASERWVESKDLSRTKKDFHALSWLHYGLLQQGDWEAAAETLQVLRDHGGGRYNSTPTWEARQLIESEDWEMKLSDSSREETRFARAYAAAHRGDLRAARKGIDSLAGGGDTEILRLELEGLVAAREGRSERAASLLAQAAELEEKTRTPSGPPDIVKPALELYGEILLEMGYCEDAAEAFERALARTPGRRLSIRGAQAAATCPAA